PVGGGDTVPLPGRARGERRFVVRVLGRERERRRDAILLARNRLDVAPELVGAHVRPSAFEGDDAGTTCGEHDGGERDRSRNDARGASACEAEARFAFWFRHLAALGR